MWGSNLPPSSGDDDVDGRGASWVDLLIDGEVVLLLEQLIEDGDEDTEMFMEAEYR